MRRAPTEPEALLWRYLRAKRFACWKFKRQQPIGPYVVDFVCFARRLVIEVDGSQHAAAAAYDDRRSLRLNRQGFRVLRAWNHEVLGDTRSVLDAIWLALHEDP